jgi:hypothetical protein
MKTNLYTIYVKTGESALGGTDSNVFIQLTGTNGRSESIHLPPQDIFAFEAGSIDKFVLEVPDLGDLTRCCIGHDGSSDADWFVESVRVLDDETAREWTFTFNMNLTTEESGAQAACVDL